MDESNQNPAHASIIGNCLSCKGLVRVPEKAPSNSKVRCPHCSESYALWQILDQAVPELELVDESEEVHEVLPRVDQVLVKKEASSESQSFVVPSQLSKGARRHRRRRRNSNSESSSNGARPTDSGSNSDSNSTFERISRQAEEDSTEREPSSKGSSSRGSSSRSSRSSRKPQRNQVAETLKVAIGGLLAIPIAYLLLFWVFKQDPLNVGPTIGQYVPFVVPAELRGLEVEPVENVENVDLGKRNSDQMAIEFGEVDLPVLDVSPE